MLLIRQHNKMNIRIVLHHPVDDLEVTLVDGQVVLVAPQRRRAVAALKRGIRLLAIGHGQPGQGTQEVIGTAECERFFRSSGQERKDSFFAGTRDGKLEQEHDVCH